MISRQFGRKAALLLLLAGCSDPYAPVASGAFWLFEASDEIFDFGDLSSRADLPPKPPAPAEPPGVDGVSWLGDQAAQVVLRRLRSGSGGVLRETERFSVGEDREVRLAVSGVFDLRFTGVPTADRGRALDCRIAWEGRPVIEQRLVMPPTANSFICLRKRKGMQYYDMLLVTLAAGDP